jgi:hypothetical protein
MNDAVEGAICDCATCELRDLCTVLSVNCAICELCDL